MDDPPDLILPREYLKYEPKGGYGKRIGYAVDRAVWGWNVWRVTAKDRRVVLICETEQQAEEAARDLS